MTEVWNHLHSEAFNPEAIIKEFLHCIRWSLEMHYKFPEFKTGCHSDLAVVT